MSSGGGSPSIIQPGENDDCSSLVINTNLASPVASVIRTIHEGDILTIQTASDEGPIQAFTQDGRLAGTIFSGQQVRLLNCISGGTQYQAEVTSVDGGQCSVQITAI